MAPQKLGIENLKLVASFAAKFGTATGKVLEDGKVDWRDAGQVPAILGSLKDLGRADLKAVVPEAKDLDEAEQKDLAAHFKTTFDWPDDKIESIVEQGLELVLSALDAILTFQRIGAQVKAAA